MSHLLFQRNHRKPASTEKAARVPLGTSTLVRIPKDLHALRVSLQQPQRSQYQILISPISSQCLVIVELGTSPKLLVTVLTGRNDISTASIRLSASPDIKFKYASASVDGSGESYHKPLHHPLTRSIRRKQAPDRRQLYLVTRSTSRHKAIYINSTFRCICISCHG